VLPHSYIDGFYTFWVCQPNPWPDLSQIKVPILFFWGTSDPLTHSGDIQSKYDSVTNAPAAKAALTGGAHAIETPYYAYIVAWFKYTLEGDALARTAFVTTSSGTPELSRNSSFQLFAGKRLP
jgi:hypothetical protein